MERFFNVNPEFQGDENRLWEPFLRKKKGQTGPKFGLTEPEN
jgi:hypothetical protein